jgi:hypothetical protein
MGPRGPIPFFTDEDVADSVGEAIKAAGHGLTRLRDAMLRGSADPVVAAACREGGLVLVTHNYRHFRRHSRELEATQKRLDRLSRVELECSQVIAAHRFTEEIALIELEWERQGGPDQPGMRIAIGDKIIRLARP